MYIIIIIIIIIIIKDQADKRDFTSSSIPLRKLLSVGTVCNVQLPDEIRLISIISPVLILHMHQYLATS